MNLIKIETTQPGLIGKVIFEEGIYSYLNVAGEWRHDRRVQTYLGL